MKQIINFLFAFYFSYNFIFHLNNNILFNFIYYVLFDTLYFIFYEKENKIKNDIILHHLNSVCIIYSYLNLNNIFNINLSYFDKLFSLQEITTLIITFKNCCTNKLLIKHLNNLLTIIWIPIRLILPYILIILTYQNHYVDNIYFRIKVFSACVFLLLNIKWTFLFLKINDNNNHYSSFILLIPIIFLKQNINYLHYSLLMSVSSLIYNIKKNKYTICLDSTMISLSCLKLCYDIDNYILLLFMPFLFSIKYFFNKSELHSMILILTFSHKLLKHKYYGLFNFLNVLLSYLYRHFKKITFLWHLSCSLLIITVLYIDNKFII